MKKLLVLCSGLCLSLGLANVYAYQVNPPTPKTYTCPQVPSAVTIDSGNLPGMWFAESRSLPSGTTVVFDNETTLKYNGIDTRPFSLGQAVQCNYTIVDTKAGKAYDMEIYNMVPVKNCTQVSSNSMVCYPD